MKKLYAAYGSNLNIQQMSMRCPEATVVGSGTLKDYELQFWGGYSSGVATVVPVKKSLVPIGVWEISETDERFLDSYEGYPHLYRKEICDILMNDGTIKKCMVYIMNRMSYGQRHIVSPPGVGYLDTIYQGYIDFNLDTDVLRKANEDACYKSLSWRLYNKNLRRT